MDITIYSTKSGDEWVVGGVPSDNAGIACRMVAERIGWRFICHKHEFGETYYAVDVTAAESEYGAEKVALAIKDVEAGTSDNEFWGLYELYVGNAVIPWAALDANAW